MRRFTRRGLFAAALSSTLLRAANLAEIKLAVTTDEIDDELGRAIAFLKRYELRYAEIRNLGGKYNTSQPLETIRRARKMLDQAGIGTAILDTGFFKVPLPPDNPEGRKKLDQQWALLERAFERAEILGTDKIRIFAFTRARGEKPDPTDYPRIFELVEEATRRAQAKGFRLALENVGRSYVGTAEQAARLLKAIPSESLGLTWDPNNSAAMGDPEPFPSGYRKLDPARIFHVHLRDYKRTPDGGAEWCGVGQGEFDHVGQFRALLQDGYRETFSLETHFLIDDSKLKATEFSIRALLKRIEKV